MLAKIKAALGWLHTELNAAGITDAEMETLGADVVQDLLNAIPANPTIADAAKAVLAQLMLRFRKPV